MNNEIIENVAEAATKENLVVVEETVKMNLKTVQKGLCVAGGFVAGGLTSFAIRHVPGVKEGLEAFGTARKQRKAAKKKRATETTIEENPPKEG